MIMDSGVLTLSGFPPPSSLVAGFAAIEIGVLLVVVLALAAIYLTMKIIKPLIYNSIIGVILLILVNATGIVEVNFSILVLAIIALGGVPGVVLVVLLAFFEIAFHPSVIDFIPQVAEFLF